MYFRSNTKPKGREINKFEVHIDSFFYEETLIRSIGFAYQGAED